MNYLPFFIVSLIAYSAITSAETTENASATTNAPSNITTASGRKGVLPKTHLHGPKTTAAPSKKRATTTAPAKKTTKTPSKKGKATTKAPEKATKATRILAQHQSHRKSDSLKIYIPTEFDNVIMNETLVQEFTDCFLDRGPCSPPAKDIKGAIAKNIKDLCAQCSDVQHSNAVVYLQHLQDHHPADYDAFLKKYDPENHMQQFLEKILPNLKPSLKSPDNKILLF